MLSQAVLDVCLLALDLFPPACVVLRVPQRRIQVQRVNPARHSGRGAVRRPAAHRPASSSGSASASAIATLAVAIAGAWHSVTNTASPPSKSPPLSVIPPHLP